MGELCRLAGGQELHEDLTRTEESVVAVDEREETAVGRKTGIDSGIGEESKLLPRATAFRYGIASVKVAKSTQSLTL